MTAVLAPSLSAAAPRDVAHAIARLADALGQPPERLVAQAADRAGPLAGMLRPVASGPAVRSAARPGDVVIVRDLASPGAAWFDVLGPEAGTPHAFEGEAVDLLRPAESWTAFLGALAPAAGGGIGQALGNGIGQLMTDPTAPVRNTIGTVNAALDLGLRVVALGAAVRSSYGGLSFTATALGLMATNEPPNLAEHTTTWRFELRCRTDRSGGDTVTYPFQAVIRHNCFSIHEARVIALAPRGLSSIWSHQLTLRVEPMSGTYGTNLPPRARFRLAGRWDPADIAGRRQEEVAGYLLVGADGTVGLQMSPTEMVRATQPIAIDGGARSCAMLYRRMTQPSEPAFGPPGAAPAPPARPARPHAPRPAAQTAPADPPFGKHVFFAPGRATTTADIEAQIAQWWGSLPPELQAPVQSGAIGLVIAGHADPTGAEAGNRALSHRRAVLVEGVVRALLRGTPRINTQAWGSQKAREAGAPAGVADPRWRRVTVTLDAPAGPAA